MHFIPRDTYLLDSYSGAGSSVDVPCMVGPFPRQISVGIYYSCRKYALRNKVCILGQMTTLPSIQLRVLSTKQDPSCPVYSVFVEGEAREGIKCLVGFQGCLSAQKAQLPLWWLLTGRDPRGQSPAPSLPVIHLVPLPLHENKALGKAPQEKPLPLKSLGSEPLLIPLILSSQLHFKHACFLSEGFE